MSFNGSGLFQINTSGQPVVTGTAIDPTVFNALTADLATGLTTCITKDGQTTPTANIPMGANKITGLAAGTAATDAANIGNLQSGTGTYVGTVGGTADVITLTPSPAIAAYAAGQTFRFIASGANTTNVTVNVNSLGAKAITKNGTTALVAGDLPASMMVEITYDGTRFILGNVGAATFVTTANHGSITLDTSIVVGDARTNSVATPLIVTSTTSNTPAAGIGTGILLKAESADENPCNFGQIEAVASDVGAGTEDTYFQLLTRVAGAALTATYRFIATAANKAIFTHANTADRTYTFPDATGNIPTIASQAEVNAMTSTVTALSPNTNSIVLETSQATTSGTSFSYTGIPSGVRRVVITFAGVSLSGTDDILVQIGPSGGVESSGYVSAAARMTAAPGVAITSSTSGFVVKNDSAANITSGALVLELMNSSTNQWVAYGTYQNAASTLALSGGDKSIAGVLSRLTVLTTGANTWDAGALNIKYER